MHKSSVINFSSLAKAIASLNEATKSAPKSSLERDGVIQRYEYTFELCWKYIRRYLLTLGRTDVSNSPRPLIRDAAEEHLLTDVASWFEFLEARNLSTHAYDEAKALQVFQAAQRFPSYAQALLKELEKRCQKWP